MAKFNFRLQRVLEYRQSLVEAQEVELGRCLTAVRQAIEELADVTERKESLLEEMDTGKPGRIRTERLLASELMVESLREQEDYYAQELQLRREEADEARRELAERKKNEQVLDRLREKELARALLAERRQEMKTLDDLTSSRHAHSMNTERSQSQ